MRNPFDTFKDLPEDLQKEAIREGEKLLDAQFAAATAADQRALTWSGFLIAAATAALGGGIALFNRRPADPVLGYVAVAFAIAILRAAWLALQTVRPTLFSFPGNRPQHWLPTEWHSEGEDNQKLHTARAEQAQHLDEDICDNRDAAAEKGALMRRSFDWAVWAVVLAGVALLLTVTYRLVTIREPTSEIISRSPPGEISPQADHT